MSDIAKVIDSVVNAQLSQTLKREGFRKHGRTFTREIGGAQQIINVQASQSNQGAEGRFTLNIALYFPAVAHRRGLVAHGAYPREYESTIRERIGTLMPERLDYWWIVGPTTNLVDLGRDLEATYRSFAAPWFERMVDLSNVLQVLLREGNSLMAAAVALELGRRDEAGRILSEAYVTARPEFAPTLRRFAERQGISLPAA